MKFVKSPISYIGGKGRLLEYVWGILPDTDRIISPFFGGGSIELNFAYHKKASVLSYDICPYLIVFWKHFVINPLQVFSGAIDIFQDNTFKDLQELYTDYTSRQPDNDFTAASIYYLFSKLGFRGCGLIHGIRKQQYDKGMKVLGRKQNMYSFDLLFQKSHIEFKCLDFSESLVVSDDLAICDPPYVSTETIYQVGSSTASKHVFNHHLLNTILKDRDNWVLFYNHCPELPYVKLAYAGYYYYELKQLSPLSNKNMINLVLFSHDVSEGLLDKGFDLQKA